jgi:hypothetical protein
MIAQRHQQQQASGQPLLPVDNQSLLKHSITCIAAHPHHGAQEVDRAIGAVSHSQHVIDEALALVATPAVVALKDWDNELVLTRKQGQQLCLSSLHLGFPYYLMA